MKKLVLIIGFIFTFNVQANNVETHLNNIRDRVRQCSVMPYRLKQGKKVYGLMSSHCPEVKILEEKGRAKIKVANHIFFAQLMPSDDTDGDLYDVVIRDYNSNETYVIENTLAFGDVLVGILGGNLKGVAEKYIGEGTQI